MAFSKTPTEDTFSEQDIRLTREINARDGGLSGKDEDLLNVFIEPVKNKATGDDRHFIVKRSGCSETVASVASGSIRGMFFWEDQSKLYYVVGQDLYIYNVNTAVSVTLSTAFSTTTGEIGFTLFLYDTGISKVVATDGTTLLTVDSSNVKTVCVDADLPSHLPYPIFLDGYIFIVKTGTADIYNSNLNDPLLWTAGDFISAEMEGDNLVRLVKINNYIGAMGSNSIEYFWDAGNPTGSPLQRNDTPIKYNTYLAGFAQFGNSIYFIGVNEGGQPDIYVLKDFKIDELGSPTVSRYLNSATSSISAWKGAVVSQKGHTFYIVNADTDRTYVLDVDTKLWARWSFQTEDNFAASNAIHVITNTNTYTYFSIGTSVSTIYKFNDSLFQDNGVSYTCRIVTEASDFGTLNRKTMPRLSVIGDRPATSASIDLYWSDDDYQTYQGPRTINLDQDLACTYNLGWFRQRNFKIEFTANENLRLQYLQAKINKGR